MHELKLGGTAKISALCCRGHAFFSANADLLDQYAACTTSEDVIAAQNAWLARLESKSRSSPEGQSLRSPSERPSVITCDFFRCIIVVALAYLQGHTSLGCLLK